MKTQILILAALLIGSNAFSRFNAEPCIVITDHDTTVCKKIVVNSDKVLMKLFDETTTSVDKNSVVTLTSNGKTFERKSLYINNKPTGQFVLMELLGQKSGLRLYRLNFSEAPAEIQKIKNSENIEASSLFLIYKNENFFLQLTESNEASILSMFNLNGLL
jgi:hypothetical protein